MKIGDYSDKFIGKVQNMINKNVEYVTIIAIFYYGTGEITEVNQHMQTYYFKAKYDHTI